MILNILILIIGFVILIKGADAFVDGSSSLARNFKVPAIFIGLTIVAFGTSAPEFAVSVQSILKGSGEIVLGNVFGSNILNILLIVGVSALFHPLTVKNNTVKKELPIVLLITSILIILINDSLFNLGDNLFSRQDAITIMLFFTVFLYYLISLMRHHPDEVSDNPVLYSIPKSFMYILIGLVGIIFGSNFVVNSASNIAALLGVSEKMIALTIIALGTSLPELVTSVTATKKGEYDIAIGNVVGSNLFNIGIVLALPVAAFGDIGNITFSAIDLAILFIAVFLLFIFSLNDRKIDKKEALLLLTVFIAYYSYVIFGA